ncbi:MAG: FMN-binding negative transcriptional regulator [Akkermansiaceae bacterium]|nr:FMN-binding negative transcriptional regulator [Armatimonadota bacterium]
MYIPKHFEETRMEVLHRLIQEYPLATLVAQSASGLTANHIPLHLAPDPAPFGSLRGHVARANPLYTDGIPDGGVLAIFQGPDAYITPSWYATKQEHGKVVPTWNYAVVHAHATIRFIDDPVWIQSHLEDLTTENEQSLAEPWAVSDAPEEYVGKLIRAIVGIELTITRIVGKWKVSQNQIPANQAGVVDGLRQRAIPNTGPMADLVADRARPIG